MIKGKHECARLVDIKMMDLYTIAPHICIVDIEHPSLRKKIIFFGTQLVLNANADLTGTYLDYDELNIDDISFPLYGDGDIIDHIISVSFKN